MLSPGSTSHGFATFNTPRLLYNGDYRLTPESLAEIPNQQYHHYKGKCGIWKQDMEIQVPHLLAVRLSFDLSGSRYSICKRDIALSTFQCWFKNQTAWVCDHAGH
jgi:hypothetical protein